jgi:type I restriction enzyme S subunit
MIKEENLPKDWKIKKIKDSCELLMGQSPPGSSYNTEGEGMPFLQGKAEFGNLSPKHIKYTNKPLRRANKGTILISVRAPVGDVNIANIDYCIGRGLASINLVNGDNKYLFYLLNYLKPKIEELGTGSTFKAITKSILEKIEIPLPPIEIQQKIVVTLEKTDKLKEFRAKSDALTTEYVRSVFLKMFVGVDSNKKLEIKKLKNISEIIMGQSPPGDSYNTIKEGIEFFQGKSEFTDRYPVVKKWTNKPSKYAKLGDILMSVRAPVGAVNLSNIDCCIGRGLAAIRCDEKINLEYLYAYFKFIENKIESIGTGSTFKAISKKQLNNLIVPVPPLNLQNQFAEIVRQMETLKVCQNDSKVHIDNLFNVIIQKAFKGDLVC